MGAADLVPGVSGGTVRIYHRHLRAFAGGTRCFRVPPDVARCVRFSGVGGVAARRLHIFWRHSGRALFARCFSLGGVLHYLLETRAHLLLAFFLRSGTGVGDDCGATIARARTATFYRIYIGRVFWVLRRRLFLRRCSRRPLRRFLSAVQLRFVRCCCPAFPAVIFCLSSVCMRR